MVGVLRSQGCKNCRRKKKGCDQQRPTCGFCARLGIACSYESKPWTFVEESGVSSAFNYSRGSSDRPAANSTSPRNSTSPTSTSRTTASPPKTGTLISSPRSLARTAFESQTYEIFYDLALPKDDVASPGPLGGPNKIPTYAWLRTISSGHGSNDPLRLSLDACAMTAIGHIKGDQELIQQSKNLYVRALRVVNHMLTQPELAKTDAAFDACALLGTYEFLQPYVRGSATLPGNDVQHHVAGCTNLVQFRGPEAHLDGHGRTLYENCRIVALIFSIVNLGILAEKRPPRYILDCWKSAPWPASSRNLNDELFDIMALAPDIMHRYNQIMLRCSTPTLPQEHIPNRIREWLDDAIELGQKLQAWEQKAISSYSRNISESSNASSSPTLRSLCSSNGYGFFLTVHYYWGTMILLSLEVTALRARLAPIYPTLPSWMNPNLHASLVTESFMPFLSPAAGIWGAQYGTYSIGAALFYYAASGRAGGPEMQSMLGALFTSHNATLSRNILLNMSVTRKDAESLVGYVTEALMSLESEKLGSSLLSG